MTLIYIFLKVNQESHYMKSCTVLLRCTHVPVNATAQGPVSIHEEIDSCKQQHHGHWVVKETQHKDGVDPIRGTAHEEEDIGRNLDKKNKMNKRNYINRKKENYTH